MPVTDEEKAAKARDAALQGALGQIEREFGKGSVMRMGDEGAQVRVTRYPRARCRSIWRSASAACQGAHRGGVRPGVLG